MDEEMERFIPACAGNTRSSSLSLPAMTVHPRLCGEHVAATACAATAAGSSPPVRGTQYDLIATLTLYRFIPACAGNTRGYRNAKHVWPVHPRLCGEHGQNRQVPDVTLGSSPPVRGTRRRSHRAGDCERFIPACAGNTASLPGGAVRRAVHPRLCGEHEQPPDLLGELDGSSPPVRGTPPAGPRAALHRRFIPACAGNTISRTRPANGDAVHPRLCGEHGNLAEGTEFTTGSSPPVRGTQRPRPGRERQDRFIPACAGNTRDLLKKLTSATVHPRLCGEHDVWQNAHDRGFGSSPPVRGTHAGRRRG